MKPGDTVHGHFPAGDPGRQLQTLPFARRLGIRWDGWTDNGVTLRLPWSRELCAAGSDRLDAGALLALIDQTCSSATFRGLRRPSLLATLDLHAEFAAPPAAQADVDCHAEVSWIDDDWALVRATARCGATGAMLAQAGSTYALGTHPGGSSHQGLTPGLIEAWRDAGDTSAARDFAALLDLRAVDRLSGGEPSNPQPVDHHATALQLPFRRSLVGAITLPALHGGAIAAAMAGAAAGQDTRLGGPGRLLGFSLRYLRAAHARPLMLAVDTVKPRGRARVHEVDARQGPDLVARASAVFARTVCTKEPDR